MRKRRFQLRGRTVQKAWKEDVELQTAHLGQSVECEDVDCEGGRGNEACYSMSLTIKAHEFKEREYVLQQATRIHQTSSSRGTTYRELQLGGEHNHGA